jgi:3-carboxy-cis,cis-muconate cycloisomerase
MPVRLIDSLATTEPFANLFSDESILRAMLAFEAALARAEARLGLIPDSAARVIEKVAKDGKLSASELARDTLLAGTPSIPFVKALTELVRAADAEAARYVHWGATSQDVADTALILILKQAQPLLAAHQSRLEEALRKLSDEHAQTVMLGRTLLQLAPPVTFGLKAAGWLGAARRGWSRLSATFSEALILQFGGASGTLASLGDRGIAAGRNLADDLNLAYPDAPWHTQRDRLAALMAACGIQTGSLAKMARDISLLMQSEVSEVAEPVAPGRGGSSTMPHKRNPVGCAVTLAAAHRVPGLVATYLSAMVQEHERAVGGWQTEWPVVSDLIQATGLATASMAEVAEGLAVDPARMLANIEATRGIVFAERVAMLLGVSVGRAVAHRLLEDATRRSITEDRQLADVLRDMPEVSRHLSPETLDDLAKPEAYLGVAEEFRKRLTREKE